MTDISLVIAAIEDEIRRRLKPWLLLAAGTLAASALGFGLGLLAFLLYTAQHGQSALIYGSR